MTSLTTVSSTSSTARTSAPLAKSPTTSSGTTASALSLILPAEAAGVEASTELAPLSEGRLQWSKLLQDLGRLKQKRSEYSAERTRVNTLRRQEVWQTECPEKIERIHRRYNELELQSDVDLFRVNAQITALESELALPSTTTVLSFDIPHHSEPSDAVYEGYLRALEND